MSCRWPRLLSIALFATVAACDPQADAGYPGEPCRGDVVSGLDRITDDAFPDCHVFHAGTAQAEGKVIVNGGRVLCVTALGDSTRQAQRAAYGAVAAIHFDGMQYRTDIGQRALARH